MPTLTLGFKGKTLQVFPLEEGLVNIGREPSCDVHIDSLAIGPQHARILTRDNICTITHNDNDNPIFVNHKPIDEHVLEHNDIIRIGKHTLRYRTDSIQTSSDDEQPEQSADTAVPIFNDTEDKPIPTEANSAIAGWLQIMSGKNLGKTFKLHSGLTDLGKLGMSPALIALRSDGYFISNLAEADKLSVADTDDIGDKSHLLHDGDLIKIGKLTLQFHLHA